MADSTRKHALGARQLLRMLLTTARGVLITLICLFAGVPRSSSQDAKCISVRVLHEKSGKPIKDLWVFVETRSGFRIDYQAIGATDAQGVVRFCIEGPIPTSFRVDIKSFSQTDPQESVDTKSVLEYGSVARNGYKKGKIHDRATPKPGERVIFGERWNWIDRLIGEWP